eukprot:SAG31_NODE_13510_length_864_cov_1.380392_1_plen_26_part_10
MQCPKQRTSGLTLPLAVAPGVAAIAR